MVIDINEMYRMMMMMTMMTTMMMMTMMMRMRTMKMKLIYVGKPVADYGLSH